MTYRTPVILLLVAFAFLTSQQLKPNEVPLPSITQEPTTTPLPVPTSASTPSPIPSPTLTPTLGPIPPPIFSSSQVYEFTNRFGGQYGVDPNVLRHIAICESGFRPEATNYIYAGLYQFSTNTWVSYRTKMGEDPNPDLRFNAEESVQTAAYALSLGMTKIWPNCQP